MSLNGLDDPTVIDAYQTALVEAGGWFLLKYASRDEVDLLSRGTGGVPEVRAAVSGYEEKSPLYGFLQYRRRKVVLKYLPEGMSRLLQARTTVQFQSVADKFSPQDTIFVFAAASELTEGALSSACLLHAASASMTSSSSSLRRQKLTGIVEDAEESIASPPTMVDNLVAKSPYVPIEPESLPMPAPSNSHDQPSAALSVSPSEETNYVRPKTGVSSSTAQTASLEELTHQLSYQARSSFQSGRPSMQDLDYPALSRPKVKLGPRPSVDLKGRPRTSGSFSRDGQAFRPVASLPAGVRVSSRKSQGAVSAERPKSQTDAPVHFSSYLKDMPPVPKLLASLPVPPPPPFSVSRPPKSPGAKSMTALPSSGMTPEKARLMKALELRKKQMEKRTKELQRKERVSLEKESLTTAPFQEMEQAAKVTNRPLSDITELPSTTDNLEDSTADEDIDGDVTPVHVLPVTTEVKETCDVRNEESPSKSIQPLGGGQMENTNVKADNTIDIQPNDMIDTTAGVQDVASQDGLDAVVEATTEKNGLENTISQVLTSMDLAPSDIVTSHPAAEAHQEQGVISQSNSSSDTFASSKPDSAVDLLLIHADKVKDTKYLNSDLSKRSNPVIIAISDCEAPSPVLAADTTDSVLIPSIMPVHETGPAESSTTEQCQKIKEDESAVQEDMGQPSEAIDHIVPAVPEEVPLLILSNETPLTVSDREEFKHAGKETRPRPPPIIIPAEYSDDDNLLSDDSLMEELKSATVQEAKPVFSMGKSPLSPSGHPQTPMEAWKSVRSVSNPSLGADIQALPIGPRPVSGTFELQEVRPIPVLVAKKVNVSSGISKRIKALEMFSNGRENGPSTPNLLPTATSTTPYPFDKFRRRASVNPTEESSSTMSSPKPNPYLTPSPSPEVSSRISTYTNKFETSVNNKRSSVSVTARIVRDQSSTSMDFSGNSLDLGPLNLQRSPLTVERDVLGESSQPTAPASGDEETRTSTASKRDALVVGLTRPESSTSPRPKSEDKRSQANGETSAGSEEKRESRASRIFRRMSSLTTSPRRIVPAPTNPGTFDGNSLPHVENETSTQTNQILDVGEVNVQFPDTLLWKRRVLRVDDEGYLILAPANVDSSTRNVVKRYHLSDFKPPCLPDEDRQELPNSILLDFLNGSTLQCACESRQGQAMVLQTLVDAHNKYQDYIH